MNITRVLLFGVLQLFTLPGSYVCQMFGTGYGSVVPIMRSAVWNEFVSQIRFLPDDSPKVSVVKKTLSIGRFLKARVTKARIGIYDVEVFRAIVQARLEKVDECPEALRIALSYKDEQAKLGR